MIFVSIDSLLFSGFGTVHLFFENWSKNFLAFSYCSGVLCGSDKTERGRSAIASPCGTSQAHLHHRDSGCIQVHSGPGFESDSGLARTMAAGGTYEFRFFH